MAEDNIPLPLDESLAAYLFRLERTTATQIRIFERGDFYSLHHDDAIFVANEFLKSPEAIKYLGPKRVPGVAISRLNFTALMRELLVIRQYRVELHAKTDNGWRRTAKGSPGNLSQFEDILFTNHDMSQSSGILSLHYTSADGTYTINLVYIDVLVKQITFCEIKDTEQFCLLESIVVQLSPKEVVLPSYPNAPEDKKLQQIFERLRMSVVTQKPSVYQADKGTTSLPKMLRAEDGLSAKMQSSDALMGCIASLVKYLDLFSDDSNVNQYEISEIALDLYMRLDGAAFHGLNVMPSSPNQPSFASLWGILNHCSTPQGQRLLSNWLKQPLLDKSKITERLDVVEALVEDSELRQNLAMALKRFPDFFRIVKKVQRNKGSLQDCYKLYMAIKQIPVLLDTLCKYDGDHHTTFNCLFITKLREYEEDFAQFSELVQTTVDLDKCDVGEFVIKHTFDEDLGELRRQLDSLNDDIEVEFNRIARVLNADKGKTIKLDVTSTYGHCFRVTRKDEKGLRQNKSLVILQTKKDGVLFTSNPLKVLSAEFKCTHKSYEDVQMGIVGEVLKVACGYADPLVSVNHLVALLDSLLSFAVASVNAPIPFVRPTILERGTGVVKLVGSRHPCVEANEDVTFISNDVSLNKEDSSFLIITGPNMGGKSTYIRQLGLSCILAQIGCFVPCQSAEISIISSIYARVGATDSQARGVSTFMAEMLDTSAILSTADSDSLIIIDELGRGTSTYDGFGLAWAISNYIIDQVGCLAVFATHFHEMTNLEHVQRAARNYHVSALVENESLALLYKVTAGPCDQSFGIHVAKLAQFPENVIQLAQEKAAELDQFQFVPESCLGAGEHGDFVGANQVIDSLLERLKEGYTKGSRGEQLRGILQEFLSDNAANISNNPILNSLVNKRNPILPVSGS